jgi:hypothetical protein
MMKTADARQGLDSAGRVRARLNRTFRRRCLFQSDVGSVIVIIGQILTPQSSQMLLIEGNDMIKYLAASTADPALRDSVLPRAPNTRANRLDAACLEEFPYIPAELGVMVEQDIPVAARKRQSLPQLLHDPIAGGMRGGIEMQDSPSTMFDDKEAVEHTEVMVGTVKKSNAAITSRWLLRKASQFFALFLSRLRPTRLRYRETVGSEISNPSWSSSP